MRTGECLQIIERPDSESIIQVMHNGVGKAGKNDPLTNGGWQGRCELFISLDRAGLHVFVNFCREVFSNAGKGLEIPGLRKLGNGRLQVGDRIGCPFIGPNPIGIFSIVLQQLCHGQEKIGERVV